MDPSLLLNLDIINGWTLRTAGQIHNERDTETNKQKKATYTKRVFNGKNFALQRTKKNLTPPIQILS